MNAARNLPATPGAATSLDPTETESPPAAKPPNGDSARELPPQEGHNRSHSPESPPSDILFRVPIPNDDGPPIRINGELVRNGIACIEFSAAENDQAARLQAEQHENEAADAITSPPNLSTRFRHSGWVRNRSLIARSMQRTDQPKSRLKEFAQCGSHAYVIQSIENPAVHRIAGSSCHDRFCLPCANERAHGIAMNVLAYVQDKTIRFLTLTLKASQQPLTDQLDRLYKSFSELRRRAFWKKRVTGGIAFLELTYNADATMWHPHFHILIEGSFLPHRELKKLWYAITGDSFVVDIRPVRSNTHAAHYVTKYASKPFNNTFLGRPGPLDEALVALKGRKLLMTFGTFRGLQVIDKPDEASWIHIAPLEVVICDAAHGDQAAIAILASITDVDLTPIFSRAPPIPAPIEHDINDHEQLTFFGAWQADGGHGAFS